MMVETRTVFADIPREHPRTGFEQQCFADRIDRAARRHTARIGAEIARAVMPRAGHNGKRRIGRIRVQPDIGIALVVLQKDVVLRLIFFDHRVLEHERFELAFGDDDIEIVNMADQLPRFGVQPLGRLKIVGHAVAQQLCLADIDHLAGLVLVQVHARLHRQTAHALLELFSCHDGTASFAKSFDKKSAEQFGAFSQDAIT